MSENKRSLPAIQDLYDNKELAIRQNNLAILCNQKPKQEWVREHPYAKKVKYIPIEVIEFLLTTIFIKWWPEILNTQLIGNSVVVTVRLHVQDPTTQQWDHYDGIGACALQTDSGAGAIEFDKLKSNAVMLAAPCAKSYAIKDAAECIGKLFGKDLNRKDEMGYGFLHDKFSGIDIEKTNHTKERDRILSALSKCNTINDVDELQDSISDFDTFSVNEEFKARRKDVAK